MALSRTKARIGAYILLFEHSFSPELSAEDFINACSGCEEVQVDDFGVDLFKGAFEYCKTADAKIAPYCKGRSLDRLSRVLLAALRGAVYEIENLDTPTSVVINCAIDFVKRYDGENTAAYCNGVLGAFVNAR